MTKRNLFDELQEGMNALRAEREGKRTLRNTVIGTPSEIHVEPQEIVALRERLGVSRAVFARMLRVNLRSLENWEQGRGGGPRGPAATLIRLASKYPDTIERMATL
jgi:putative transcriptional regulator